MKKLFLVSVMLTAALVIQAQLKVAPKLDKGTTKVYVTQTTTTDPGQDDIHVSVESKYTVTGKKGDGYQLEFISSNFKSDAASDNIVGQMLTANDALTNGLLIKLTTDKDGQVTSLDNYADLKAKIDKTGGELVDKLFEKVPMLSQMMQKDALKQQFLALATEENILSGVKNATTPLALNGKTLMTGMQDIYTNNQGLKMKRMYFVNGQSVTSNASLDMNKDDLKAFIIKTVEKTAPQQADMVKENIDQLMDSGMLKIDVKETVTYEIGADGWVKSMNVENTNNMLGQSVKVTATITCK